MRCFVATAQEKRARSRARRHRLPDRRTHRACCTSGALGCIPASPWPSSESACFSRARVALPHGHSGFFFGTAAVHSHHRPVACPVKLRAGIGLARRRDIAMPDDLRNRIALRQRPRECREAPVLGRRERRLFIALDLYADREIVATWSPLPTRLSRVPRALRARHELDDCTVAAHQEMRRCLQTRDRRKERVCPRVEPVGKKFLDGPPAELTRRQADVMDGDKLNAAGSRALVAVGRRDVTHPFEDPFVSEFQSHASTVPQ